MWAAEKGFEPIVKMLLAKGASVEYLDQSGVSPLLWALRACTSRLREIVTRSYGAVITNGTGDTNAVVWLLLRYGANPNIGSHHSRVPLFWAISSSSAASVEALLKAGCDPIAKNRYGRPPLMSATIRGKVWIIAALLTSLRIKMHWMTMEEARSWKVGGRGIFMSFWRYCRSAPARSLVFPNLSSAWMATKEKWLAMCVRFM